MDLGDDIFMAEQSYVALSRVTHLSGLALIQLDCSKIYADEKVLEENNTLREIASRSK